ncbi:hypothetical protein ACHWQZ_G000168 [Mnemiopsis leidyi]
MSDKDQQPAFVVPVSPLDKMLKQVPPLAEYPNNNTPLSQYFNGAFVDLLQQSKLSQSLKSRELQPRDWQNNSKTTEDFEWSSEQIVTLLEFYSQYPQLWDTKHERYMNKDVRKQLISQLSEKIGAPEQAVNVKFQRLRVHFSRELRKEESSVQEPQPYQSKWKYYNNMLFLKDTLKCRQKIRQHNNEKDTFNLMMDMSNGNNGGLIVTSTVSSDSGHSSPDSTNTISPSVPLPENKENMSPPMSTTPSYKTKTTVSPLSPSLISAPFSTLSSSSLVPPLLASNPLFSSLPTSLPTPPASLLNSFASLEHLLSPRMLAPLLINKTVKKEAPPQNCSQGFNPLLNPSAAGTLLAPTPQLPTSPLTPNVVCSAPSFWNSPHVLTSAKEDEDSAALKSYQAKRQKIKQASRDKVEMGSPNEQLVDCDYFSLHVSESLKKMDIFNAEECKRAIQNTIYQHMIKSCQRQPGFFNTSMPFPPRFPSPNTTNVRLVNRKS